MLIVLVAKQKTLGVYQIQINSMDTKQSIKSLNVFCYGLSLKMNFVRAPPLRNYDLTVVHLVLDESDRKRTLVNICFINKH